MLSKGIKTEVLIDALVIIGSIFRILGSLEQPKTESWRTPPIKAVPNDIPRRLPPVIENPS